MIALRGFGVLLVLIGLWESFLPQVAWNGFKALVHRHQFKYIAFLYAFIGVMLFFHLKRLSVQWLGMIAGSLLVIIGLLYLFFEQEHTVNMMERALPPGHSIEEMVRVDGGIQMVLGGLILFLAHG